VRYQIVNLDLLTYAGNLANLKVIFSRFYGHTVKRVISNPEVSSENQERRKYPVSPQKIYSMT